MKGKGAIDCSKVTRWFKKFCTSCKKLNDQASSCKPRTMDSNPVLQAIVISCELHLKSVK